MALHLKKYGFFLHQVGQEAVSPLLQYVSGVRGYAAMCVVQATLYLFTPTYRELLLLLLLLSEQ